MEGGRWAGERIGDSDEDSRRSGGGTAGDGEDAGGDDEPPEPPPWNNAFTFTFFRGLGG